MIVLLVFALLAGAGTALSPCVLPVLPALLSASGVGGRRRPLGIVIGLCLTFAITIVGVASVVGGVGVGSDPLRDLAIAVLLVFGVRAAGAGPGCSDRGAHCRGWRVSARARAATGSVRGWSWAERSGSSTPPAPAPILAAVIIGQRGERPGGRCSALAYALGSGAVLFAARARRQAASSTALRRAGAGSCAAAGARRGDGRDRRFARHDARRQARPVDRAAHPQRQHHRRPRATRPPSPNACTRSPVTRPASWRPTALLLRRKRSAAASPAAGLGQPGNLLADALAADGRTAREFTGTERLVQHAGRAGR